MRVLGPIGVERSVQTDPTWLLYASATIASERQRHFRSSLLSLQKIEKRPPEMRLLFTGYGDHGTKEMLGVVGSKL